MRVYGCLLLLASLLVTSVSHAFAATQGYYRYPALHGDTLIFTTQGDLWKVSARGGVAQPLTSHPGQETNAAISPDGTQVAFSAQYEGPTEVYVMPISGGPPTRLTYDGDGDAVVGWTPEGSVLYSTRAHSTLPDARLFAVNPKTRVLTPIPLAQAADGSYDAATRTLFFTRLPFQGSHTKRYKGGTAQTIWKWNDALKEALPLTGKYEGTSKNPMYYAGRVYFVSDRDGIMNLWSMDANGGGLKQLTHHPDFDVATASLDAGRIVYQCGADLYLYDINAGRDTKLAITVGSDEDETRERWVKNPLQYLTAVSFAPDGSRIAFTARGQVFVAPAKQGRFVAVTHKPGVRFRDAVFSHDGKSLLALADTTKETEWWRFPANGVGAPEQLSFDAHVLRQNGVPSPDGNYLAYTDRNNALWLLDLNAKKTLAVATAQDGNFTDLRWSPDSRYLAYVAPRETFDQVELYSVADGKRTPVTTDRFASHSPAWSPDGKWLYFLSNRTLASVVGSPWGDYQPEPYFPDQTKIYALALTKGQRWPFAPANELHEKPEADKPELAKPNAGKPEAAKPTAVSIDFDGLAGRLYEVPVPAGSYSLLNVSAGRLFWLHRASARPFRTALETLDIGNTEPQVRTLADEVTGYDLSQDGKKVLISKREAYFVVDAGAGAPASLEKAGVNLADWTFSLTPRDEWRQMFVESWRLERDYFYDPKLHGVDYNTIFNRYYPLVERVRDRYELSDLIGQVVGELSALHTFVDGGDVRSGSDTVEVASLGAEWVPDREHGGCRVTRVYSGNPDFPATLAPLSQPEVGVQAGDVIQSLNGVSTLSVADPAELLRGQAGKQVLLHVRDGKSGAERDVIVTPISAGAASGLRYTDWELDRRSRVEKEGAGKIGYVHLRAMGGGDMAQWAREFYPVFNRDGLIIDVRHNGGGNIDSWILEKLLRKPWFYWQPRPGAAGSRAIWNMPYAFRGHVVLLCDEWTASDGEAFSEGFRRLGLGKVIGTRTWGGEIWLSFDNPLVDNGIASAAEMGVYGPEGKWLIEGRGVEPDIVVDNPPHAVYLGADPQLEAALAELQKEIKAHPTPVPPTPAYPNKASSPRPPRPEKPATPNNLTNKPT